MDSLPRQQPQSLSLDDEFVVISKASSTSQSSPSPPPQDLEVNSANSAAYHLSLLKQTTAGAGAQSESPVQQLTKQIDQVVSQQIAGTLHHGLSRHCHSLEQLRDSMGDRLKDLQEKLALRDAELTDATEECGILRAAKAQMAEELGRLRNQQEEWQQMSADYKSLKNNYNLLSNTRERLESEKAELLRSRDEALAAETERLRTRLDEEYRMKGEAEVASLQATHEAELRAVTERMETELEARKQELAAARADSQKALDSERTSCVSEMETARAKHQEAVTTMRAFFDEQSQQQQRLLDEARQELTVCIDQHEAEKAELMEQLKFVSNCQLSSIEVATETEASLLIDDSQQQQQQQLELELQQKQRYEEEILQLRQQLAKAMDHQQQQQPQQAGDAPQLSDSAASGARLMASQQHQAHMSDVGTKTESAPSLPSSCYNCSRLTAPMLVLRERPGVQEQGSMTASDTASIGVMTVRVSAETAEVSVSTCPGSLPVETAEVAVMTPAVRVSSVASCGSPMETAEAAVATTTACAQEPPPSVSRRSKTSQTDPLAGTEVAVSASLQKNSVVRNLQMQIAQFAQALRTERVVKEQLQKDLDSVIADLDETRNKVLELQKQASAVGSREQLDQHKVAKLEAELKAKQTDFDSVIADLDETRAKIHQLQEQAGSQQQWDQKTAKLESQLKAKQTELDSVIADLDETRNKVLELQKQASAVGSREQWDQHKVAKLEVELKAKQTELDSVIVDLDETRTKVCELQEQAKRSQNCSIESDTQAGRLRQKIQELEGQLQIGQETAHQSEQQLQMELDSAHKEQLFKDEKLQSAEKTVEQLRLEVQRLAGQEDEMNRRCRDSEDAVKQVLASAEEDRKRLDGELESLKSKNQALMESLDSNARVLEKKAEEEMQLRDAIADLVRRLSSQADEHDVRMADGKRRQDQLYRKFCDQSELRLQAEKQLAEMGVRLEDSERFAGDMQAYSDGLETEIQALKQQLQESSRKRDEVMGIAEQLRDSFQHEADLRGNVESELAKMKLENSKLRADFSEMEQSVTQMVEAQSQKEHEMADVQRRLGQAEEALGYYKDQLHLKETELTGLKDTAERLTVDRDALRLRVNRLIEEVTSPERQQDSFNELLERHGTLRPPQGGGHK